MSKSIDLARTIHYKRTGQQLPINATLETVFAVLDHLASLHYHDRDRASERIKALEEDAKTRSQD